MQELQHSQVDFKRYKSPVIHTSIKKMLQAVRVLKLQTLKKAWMYFYCLNKKISKTICKFLKYIIKNLEIRHSLTCQEAESRIIAFTVLEKTAIKSHGTRFAAKGRAYRSSRTSSRLNIYIK